MLDNTLYKLKNNKELTIGFFGGSITEGAGASDASRTSWRGSVMRWFRERYPDHEIREIQAAIGGTGSSLGIFRCERDLLSKKPDLVFMEYSVNDGLGDYDTIMTDSETIVRKIYASDPHTDIVYVHTTTKYLSDHIASGGEYTARSAHSAVMHRYGIPQTDVGEILRSKVTSSGGDWKTLTTDTVHPNDDGYAVYTGAITKFLADMLDKAEPVLSEKVLPEQLSRPLRLDARLVDASEGELSGFGVVRETMCGRYDGYIEGEPGASLTYEFEGRRVGLYLMLAKDSGDLLWSVDGGDEKSLRTWDSYCKSFNRAGGMLLGGELTEGHHTLRLRVADTKADESDGKVVRIGAFMVY